MLHAAAAPAFLLLIWAVGCGVGLFVALAFGCVSLVQTCAVLRASFVAVMPVRAEPLSRLPRVFKRFARFVSCPVCLNFGQHCSNALLPQLEATIPRMQALLPAAARLNISEARYGPWVASTRVMLTRPLCFE